MDTLVLFRDDIGQIVRNVGIDALMDEMIERLTRALSAYSPDHTFTPARQGFSYMQPVEGLIEWMPCHDDRHQVMLKVVGYHPQNYARNRMPTVVSTLSTYDTETGHLRCLMDGTFATALRTGAASAVATRILARPDAEVIGMIGAGAQAVTQLHAMTCVLPVRRVLVHDVDARVELSYIDRVAPLSAGLTVEIVDLDELVESADVICTATSIEVGGGPLFDGLEPRAWCHFNAIGSDFPGKVELPRQLLDRSLVCPDFREQAIREGECQQLPAEAIGPELYQLVQQADRFESMREQLTVFDSTGWALEDHLAQTMLAAYAEDLGLGRHLPIEVLPKDPINPYEFAQVRVH